jgi:hypothetical protein
MRTDTEWPTDKAKRWFADLVRAGGAEAGLELRDFEWTDSFEYEGIRYNQCTCLPFTVGAARDPLSVVVPPGVFNEECPDHLEEAASLIIRRRCRLRALH